MPVHDWTSVFPGTFHSFHLSWAVHLTETLNQWVLPAEYYALIERPSDLSDVADEATTYRLARRTLAIRHRTHRRLVAMIEIVSPGNKDGEQHLAQFVDKSVEALRSGVHLLVVDLHPLGASDPQGIHGAIWEIVGGRGFKLPQGRNRTLAAYMAERPPEAFVEPLAVDHTMPDMPLFLAVGWYINVPLEATYTAAYERMPKIVRDVVEGRSPPEWELE